MTDHADWRAPGADAIHALARAAFDALPRKFLAQCQDVTLHVEDHPDDDLLDELGAEDPFEVTAIYEGAGTSGVHPDGAQATDKVIFFRRPILDEWCARGDVALGDLMRHILVHEIAHHFGMTDAQIAQIDDWTA